MSPNARFYNKNHEVLLQSINSIKRRTIYCIDKIFPGAWDWHHTCDDSLDARMLCPAKNEKGIRSVVEVPEFRTSLGRFVYLDIPVATKLRSWRGWLPPSWVFQLPVKPTQAGPVPTCFSSSSPRLYGKGLQSTVANCWDGLPRIPSEWDPS
jgi:hypothetical protein